MSSSIANAKLNPLGYIELSYFQQDITLSLSEVKYGWDLAEALDPEKKTGVYLKTAPWSLLDKEARNYAIHEIKARPFVAILVHNLGQRLMGNFVVSLTGKSTRVKIFEKDDTAKTWLLEKIEQFSTKSKI